MTDAVVIEQNGQTVVVVTSSAPQTVEIVAAGPQGPQGEPGIIDVSTAEFDAGNASVVFTSGPSLDLGSAA